MKRTFTKAPSDEDTVVVGIADLIYVPRMSDATNATEAPPEPAEELATVKEELAVVKEKLRRAHQDFERFSYFLSHDFRAPIRHITSFAGLLDDELREHENHDITTWLGFMTGGAKLIQRLVDEALLFSRARRAKAEVGETVVANMIAELESAALAPKEGLTVESQISTDVVVAMAPHHAAQIFGHLFSNAIYFRKEGRAAELSLSSRSAAKGKMWEIEFRDEGRGVRGDAIQNVFDAFYRSSDSPRESPGLGLSLARHLLSLYGGIIELESEHGAFTTVRVLLPSA
ncbi:MAG: signal transduction histidine kinase [Polyangiales bacterium]|jgi:signal transduction histidine kinase